jgi:hypothetical protein
METPPGIEFRRGFSMDRNKIFQSLEHFFFSRRPRTPYDDEWRRDQEWGRTSQSKSDADYDAVKKFAEDQYTELRAIFESVDKKAEWIFGIAFAASGALMFAMKSWGLGLYCAPSLLCTLLAMHWSLRAKATGEREIPLSIRAAVEVVENDPSWKLVFIASAHCTCGALKRLIDWKGSELQKATRSLFGAAMLFALPALIAPHVHQSEGRPDLSLQIDRFELSGSAKAAHIPLTEAARGLRAVGPGEK